MEPQLSKSPEEAAREHRTVAKQQMLACLVALMMIGYWFGILRTMPLKPSAPGWLLPTGDALAYALMPLVLIMLARATYLVWRANKIEQSKEHS